MRCPSCGFEIDQSAPDRCPQCGRALAATPVQAPRAPDAPQSTPSVAPAAPATSAASPSDPPLQNPYGPFQPYGNYAPPGGYGQPPDAPGYPPPGYPQLAPLSSAPAPAPTHKKPRTRLIIAIVAVAVVVLAACGWGVIATVQAIHPPALSAVPRETPIQVYSNDFSSNAGGWGNSSNCFLGAGGYHVTDDHICYAPIGNYSDVDITVTVKQLSGTTNSPMGIAFHLLAQNGAISQFYLFSITADGRWGFSKCNSDSCSYPINFRSEGAINQGTGTSNSLEVYAKGAHMDFFINGKAVGSLDDSSYSTGMIGLVASDGECVFTNLFIGELD